MKVGRAANLVEVIKSGIENLGLVGRFLMSSKNRKRQKVEPREHYKEGIPRKGPNLRHAATCQLSEMEPTQIFKNMTASA